MLTDQAQALRSMVAQAAAMPARRPADAVRRPCRAQIVAVTSGKGGVGKSNITVNLAVRLAQLRRRVAVLDADLGTANIDVLCNLRPMATLADVIASGRSLSDVMMEAPGGFHLVPGASGLAHVAAMEEHERLQVVDQLCELEQSADLILIDTGAGVGPNVLSFALSADQVLVVTTPEPTAITDAYAVIKAMAQQRPQLDLRLVVNMVRDAAEGRQVYERLDSVCRRFCRVQLRYVGHVVSDPAVAMAVRQRLPVTLSHPASPATLCVRQVAQRMWRFADPPREESLIRRMAGWLGRSGRTGGR